MWDALSAGQPADLEVILGEPAPNIDDDAAWEAASARALSERFLKDLFAPPYSSALRGEVAFVGARFDSDLYLKPPPATGLSFTRCRTRHLFFRDGELRGPFTLARTYVMGVCSLGDLKIEGDVRISGSWIAGTLNLGRVEVKGALAIEPEHQPLAQRATALKKTILQGGLNARDSFFDQRVRLNHVECRGWLLIEDCVIGRDASISDCSSQERISLKQSRVGGTLNLHGNDAPNGISLERAIIGDRVSIHGSEAPCSLISATGIRVGRSVAISTVQSPHGIMLEEATIGGDLLVRSVTADDNARISLTRARVSGDAGFFDVSAGTIHLMRSRIDGDVRLDGSRWATRVDATDIRVDGTLYLGDADLHQVNLTSATVGRDLSLLSWIGKEPRWQPGARLSLRNATADAVHDSEAAWPNTLDLEGFEFKRIGSHGFAHEPLPARDFKSLKAWLARDPNASAQPYVQLARVLQEAGQIAKANDILYAARQRERRQVRRNAIDYSVDGVARLIGALAVRFRSDQRSALVHSEQRRGRRVAARRRLVRRRCTEGRRLTICGLWLTLAAMGLWLLEMTMGYGLGPKRYFRACGWVAGFVLAGVVALCLDQHIHGYTLTAKSKTLAWMLFASLDAMLPIVSLDSSFAAAVPTKLVSIWSKAFFWVQGLVGWVLGAFLAAGLAGLTQRPN